MTETSANMETRAVKQQLSFSDILELFDTPPAENLPVIVITPPSDENATSSVTPSSEDIPVVAHTLCSEQLPQVAVTDSSQQTPLITVASPSEETSDTTITTSRGTPVIIITPSAEEIPAITITPPFEEELYSSATLLTEDIPNITVSPPSDEIPAITVTPALQETSVNTTSLPEQTTINTNSEGPSSRVPLFPVDLMPDAVPDQIIPRLYISNIVGAEIVIQDLWRIATVPRFTHVLSIHSGRLADQQRLLPPAGSTLRCKQILIDDRRGADILEWFPEICKFIHQALGMPMNSVLVHCYAGRSRSVSAVAAYLMWAFHFDRPDALLLVAMGRRGGIWPNGGFGLQLELWGALGCDLVGEEAVYRVAKEAEGWESCFRGGRADVRALVGVERPQLG